MAEPEILLEVCVRVNFGTGNDWIFMKIMSHIFGQKGPVKFWKSSGSIVRIRTGFAFAEVCAVLDLQC